MTTAVAWSIGARVPEAGAERRPSVPWTGADDAARRSQGFTVVPLRRTGPRAPGSDPRPAPDDGTN